MGILTKRKYIISGSECQHFGTEISASQHHDCETVCCIEVTGLCGILCKVSNEMLSLCE
jgi:hypothetical protein